jgi:hypothetical protein
MNEPSDELTYAELAYELGLRGELSYKAMYEELVGRRGWTPDRFAKAYDQFRDRMEKQAADDAQSN